MIRGHGVEQDVVEVAGLEFGVGQRRTCSEQAEIRGSFADGRKVPLHDTRPLSDPLVVRIENAREVVIGVRSTGQMPAGPDDAEARHEGSGVGARKRCVY
jgi:hypothetical protein